MAKNKNITRISKWQSSDGSLHDSPEAAATHQSAIDALYRAETFFDKIQAEPIGKLVENVAFIDFRDLLYSWELFKAPGAAIVAKKNKKKLPDETPKPRGRKPKAEPVAAADNVVSDDTRSTDPPARQLPAGASIEVAGSGGDRDADDFPAGEPITPRTEPGGTFGPRDDENEPLSADDQLNADWEAATNPKA